MKIKAAVVDKKGDQFAIRDDIELAEMQPDDIQVKMVASGICHSDEALRKGDAVIDYPIILGHEGSGIVEKVGSHVQNFEPGDHVVLSFYSCRNCENCLKGKPTQCLHYGENNLSGVRPDKTAHFTENGEKVADMFDQSSFTTTTVVRESNAVKVPKELDLRKLGAVRMRLCYWKRYGIKYIKTTSGTNDCSIWYWRCWTGRNDGWEDCWLYESDRS
jgi:Zn-dependent alcohol dehydrogenases, class III